MTRRILQIDSFAHGGLGVARDDGRVVFVADALPGERVEVELTEEKKSFARAVTVDVIDASPDRVDHVWSAADVSRAPADRAGGADLGFVALPRQRQLKGDVITDALTRFAGGAVPVRVIAVEPNLGWRSRVSLHVDAVGIAGPRAARSHRVIEVSEYPLAHPEIQAQAPWAQRFPGAERIELLASSSGELRTDVVQPGERRNRSRRVHEVVNGRQFTVAESGFWQVHTRAAETLQAAVDRAIDSERFDPAVEQLDLYGGVGLLSVPLLNRAGRSAKLVTVESDALATEFAQDNLAEWVGSRAVTGRVDHYLRRESIADGATVVLDPPRAGAGREVVEALAASHAAQLVYVACDPVAFARDLGTFRSLGWDVDTLEAFDLFPHTHHVEVVARITRRYSVAA